MNGPVTPDLPLLDRKRFDKVGYCIYCGSVADLTDEHIIPFGLGGHLVLPKSSCRRCARITGEFERVVLRGPLRAVRIARGIQSRRRHRDVPTSLPLLVRRNEEWETILLPYGQYPLIFHFFVYDVPGYLEGASDGRLRVKGQLTYSFGPRPEEVAAAVGAKQVRIQQQYVPGEFAKMTAKVAFAMAVAEGAIDPQQGRPEVVRSILGEVDEIGRWVGMVAQPRHWVEGVLHTILIQRDDENGLLLGRVQYLTDTGTPFYTVVLGRLDDPYVVAARDDSRSTR